MRSKFILFSQIVIIIVVLMISTIPIAAASPAVPISVNRGWHKETLNIQVQGERIFTVSKIRETGRYEYWKIEFDIDCDSESDMEHIILTMLIKEDKMSSKWQVVSFKFQGDDLCFTGWKGKGYSDDMEYYYEIHGLGVGSYGYNNRCRNAFVKGNISLVDHSNEPTPWIFINLQATIKYFIP